LREKNFTCSICGKKFVDNRGLTKHTQLNLCSTIPKTEEETIPPQKFASTPKAFVVKDEETGIFKRLKCAYTSPDQSNAKQHFERQHLKSIKCVWGSSNEGFRRKEELANHLRDAHDDTLMERKSKFYKCEFCTYKSQTRNNVVRHITVIHRKEKNYHCSDCGMRYSEQKSLKKHISKNTFARPDGNKMLLCSRFTTLPSEASKLLKKDEDSKYFNCLKCSYASSSLLASKRHVERIHLTTKRLICNICKEGFSWKPEVARHYELEHNDTVGGVSGPKVFDSAKLKCQMCPYTSSSRNYLQRHFKLVHLKERNFLCAECGNRYSNKRSLDLHISKSTVTKNDRTCVLRCSKFRKLPSQVIELIKKNEEFNEFNCLQCDYKSSILDLTKRHVERVHLNSNRIICNTCNKDFPSKPKLIFHLAKDHNDMSLCENVTDISTLDPGPYQCEQCSYSSPNISRLKRHVRAIHLNEKNYLCSDCGKCFSENKSLKTHVANNTLTSSSGVTSMRCTKYQKVKTESAQHIQKDESSNTFNCLQCSYSSNNLYLITKHVDRVHLKAKRFQCTACDQSFKLKPQLVVHLAKDHNDTSLYEKSCQSIKLEPIQCQFCSYTSTVPKNVDRHVSTVHAKSNMFTCARCDKSYSQKKSLTRHFQNHHQS
jgi:KRAB domain-containing zinc finger protein